MTVGIVLHINKLVSFLLCGTLVVISLSYHRTHSTTSSVNEQKWKTTNLHTLKASWPLAVLTNRLNFHSKFKIVFPSNESLEFLDKNPKHTTLNNN